MNMNKTWLLLLLFIFLMPIVNVQAASGQIINDSATKLSVNSSWSEASPHPLLAGSRNPVAMEVLANANTGHIGENMCEDNHVQDALRFVGFLLLFIKILVPFAIIFMGTLDFYKVAVEGKDEAVKKQTITLGKRLLSGILIFFVPTFLNMTFTLISSWSEVAEEYEICATCLFEPSSCDN